MLIEEDLLRSFGAVTERYSPGDFIFKKSEIPAYYFQIIEGRVKINTYDEDDKEFIQSILTAGQSVCELLLFLDRAYPVNAVALTPCHILKISKSSFLELLNQHFSISLAINRFLSERLYQKFIRLQDNSSIHPQVRLTGLLNYLKSFSENTAPYSFEILLTRQQIASATGLRVETVIRTFKNMEKEGILKIENHKIFY